MGMPEGVAEVDMGMAGKRISELPSTVGHIHRPGPPALGARLNFPQGSGFLKSKVAEGRLGLVDFLKSQMRRRRHASVQSHGYRGSAYYRASQRVAEELTTCMYPAINNII